jgi:hypothetical protein
MAAPGAVSLPSLIGSPGIGQPFGQGRPTVRPKSENGFGKIAEPFNEN